MITERFEIFFREHFRSAVLMAEKVVGSRQAAEDVVQDVFIRMLDLDMDKIGSVPHFFYRSVRNASIDYIRSRANHVWASLKEQRDPAPAGHELTEEELEYAQNLAKLYNAIERLPEQSRKVVWLVCLENYSYNDAATQLGVSVSTIKTHMYRSFKFLREILMLFL